MEKPVSDGARCEWTIWNVAGNYPLGSVGDRADNEERLALLEREAPGLFHLVCRHIGPWVKP